MVEVRGGAGESERQAGIGPSSFIGGSGVQDVNFVNEVKRPVFRLWEIGIRWAISDQQGRDVRRRWWRGSVPTGSAPRLRPGLESHTPPQISAAEAEKTASDCMC